MSTKSATTPRRPKTRPAPLATAAFGHTAVEALHHGVRVRPKPLRPVARPKTGKAGKVGPAVPRGVGTVEVRLEPDAGSTTWRELVTLVTVAAVDRLASVPEAERTQLLADLRDTMGGEGADARSAAVLAALRRVATESAPTDDSLPAANHAALERAFARADATQTDLLRGPDMLTGEALAARVGLTRATVDNRRKANQLLALELGTRRGVRYPAWQAELVTDADTRRAFEATLAALVSAGPWSRYRFFTTEHPALADRTPIEGLQAGKGTAVTQAATTWAAGEQGGH